MDPLHERGPADWSEKLGKGTITMSEKQGASQGETKDWASELEAGLVASFLITVTKYPRKATAEKKKCSSGARFQRLRFTRWASLLWVGCVGWGVSACLHQCSVLPFVHQLTAGWLPQTDSDLANLGASHSHRRINIS